MEVFNNIPLHMNVMVIFFSILPFVVLLSINYARNKKYKLHLISQGFVLILTLLVLAYFEVMIRIDGGFFEFAKQSNMSHDFLVKYLFFHIALSIIAAILWIRLFFNSMSVYRAGKIDSLKNSKHKRDGKITFLFLLLSCVTGVFLYLFLFIF
ncbi:MAG: hypothetical protein C0626_04415 [Arcobacter sp.]|uniref:DUF420 domain-containing protein n=1 Tax=uncultured Arcobacter sp. TaxID=165434 RepID=UPI000CA9D74D|nr:DUF420 domain-containing protein [uncultured Arcobacter sp.]PLY10882.1 MAG: hypothetical protein C0626_04415 [Arcobacter sp.]